MAIKKKEEASKSTEESVFDETSKKEKVTATVTEEGVVEVVEEKEAEEASMPISAVEKLLQNMEDRFNSKIQKLTFGKSKSELKEGEALVADLEEDWLDVPVVFFAYSINYSIYGDNKLGKATSGPQGPVRFKPIIRSKRQTAKGVEVISVSSVKIHSKEVAKWLRNHSQFGIAFFENMESALNIDSGWAQRLIEANQSIQKMSDQAIIARCRQEGLPIGTDPVAMRKALVEFKAKQSLKHHEDLQYKKLKSAKIDPATDRQLVDGGKINV